MRHPSHPILPGAAGIALFAAAGLLLLARAPAGPRCDGPLSAAKVTSLFNLISQQTKSGTTARTVTAQAKHSHAGEALSCTAIVTASDGRSFGVAYTIRQIAKQFYYDLRIQEAK